VSEPTEVPLDETATPESVEEAEIDATGAEREAAAPTWIGGGFVPYEVGDPGRAAREVVASVGENPSDPADTQLDAGESGDLVVRVASVRGTSHRHSGTPRQDDYALCSAGDWLVLVVADGVSAGALSHQAATIACRSAATFVREALLDGGSIADVAWTQMLNEAARRILVHGRRTLGAGDEEIPLEEIAKTMATTLVVVAVPHASDEDGGRCATGISFGDTSVFVLGAEGEWHAATKIKNDGADIATSATVALPLVPVEAIEPLEIWINPGDAMFVMTDGVGDPLGRGEGPVGDFLADVWKCPPDMLSFGGQVGFARRSFDDDRTVVGVWTRA
jgi:hypothetical protein